MGRGYAYRVSRVASIVLTVLMATRFESMREWASMFPEKGFTCIETDLTMPESPASDSEALMHHFEDRERPLHLITSLLHNQTIIYM